MLFGAYTLSNTHYGIMILYLLAVIGQFGWPTFNLSLFISMLAATAASIADSIGDYGICSRICMVRHPPKHAVNRGIAIEGIGSIFAGLLGSAHATTTYTGTMGLIVITKVSYIIQ